MSKVALIRRPSPRMAEGIVTHIERSPVDVDLAVRQWEAYVDALHQHGWETIEVAPAPDCPDSVFIEDPVFVYGDRAVLARSGAQERRAEVAAVEKVIRELGYNTMAVQAPGEIDGGDVLKVGNLVRIGVNGRTNHDGIRQVAEHLAPLGAHVVGVPLKKVLHLKSGVTALPDGTVIGYEPLVDHPEQYARFLPMPEEGGSHVVILDDTTLLMSASCPQSAEILRGMGFETVVVDISEFEKMEGCVTCLSVRLRDLPAG